jgi:CO/xanthine dehydrogenase Mo-binding subunit
MGCRAGAAEPSRQGSSAPTRGRVASGYWFNGGGESSASVQVNEDGTVIIATGSPDIGGSRASMALMAAETLGIDYNQIRSIVADKAASYSNKSPIDFWRDGPIGCLITYRLSD